MKPLRKNVVLLGISLLALASVGTLFLTQRAKISLSAGDAYSCALPSGYVEIADVLEEIAELTPGNGTSYGTYKSSSYKVRGTITRKAGAAAYLQRVNQVTHELDAVCLYGVGSLTDLTEGAVVDIYNPTLVNYYGTPELKDFTYEVAYAVNPTGYEPLVYESAAEYLASAFTNTHDDPLFAYSRLVRVNHLKMASSITAGNVSKDSYSIRGFSISSEDGNVSFSASINAGVASQTNAIKSTLNGYYQNGTTFDAVGVLYYENSTQVLRLVSTSDLHERGSVTPEPETETWRLNSSNFDDYGSYSTGNFGSTSLGGMALQYYRIASSSGYCFKLLPEPKGSYPSTLYNTSSIGEIVSLSVTYSSSSSWAIRYGKESLSSSISIPSSGGYKTTYEISLDNARFFALESSGSTVQISSVELEYIPGSTTYRGPEEEMGTFYRLPATVYSGSLTAGSSSINVPTSYQRSGNTYVVTATKRYTYYSLSYVKNHSSVASAAAMTSKEDVANYYIAFGEFPANYVTKSSSSYSTASSLFDEDLRLVSTYSRTDGYAGSVPYRGYKPSYHELDIALDDSYSTSSRGVGRLVIWEDGFSCYESAPVAVYTDDHYFSFREYLNDGTFGPRFDAEGRLTARDYASATTLSLG